MKCLKMVANKYGLSRVTRVDIFQPVTQLHELAFMACYSSVAVQPASRLVNVNQYYNVTTIHVIGQDVFPSPIIIALF